MIYNRPGLRLIIRIALLAIEIFIASYLLIIGQFLFGAIVLLFASWRLIFGITGVFSIMMLYNGTSFSLAIIIAVGIMMTCLLQYIQLNVSKE